MKVISFEDAMDEEEFAELVANERHACCGCCGGERPPEQSIQAQCLKDALDVLQKPCTLTRGQLLVLKKGLDAGLDFHPDTVFIIAQVIGNSVELLAYDKRQGAVRLNADSRFFEDLGEVG